MSGRGELAHFGYNLRLLRLRGGLTQEQLAAAAGTSTGRICRVERGHGLPRLPVALRLARALRCPLESLVGPRLPPC